MDPVEFEVKLRPPAGLDPAEFAAILRAEGAALRAPRRKSEQDAYHDTADWDVYRQGFALRVRRGPRGARAQLKELRPLQAGAAARAEHEAEIAAGDDAWPARLPAAFAARLRELTGGRPLRELFHLHQERELWTATFAGGVAEASWDRCRFITPSGETAHQEVELELRAGDAAAVQRFAARLAQRPGWAYATAGKFELGLRFNGLQPPVRSA